ncbi:MAG: hypothetical protein MJ250_03660 [Alphaproteobacteria bacterium]|nr:hypothetical protein [Alphaproteobacteria bacterium]
MTTTNIEEKTENQPVEQKEEENVQQKQTKSKGHGGLCCVLVLAVLLGGVFGVPQSRNAVMPYVLKVWDKMREPDMKVVEQKIEVTPVATSGETTEAETAVVEENQQQEQQQAHEVYIDALMSQSVSDAQKIAILEQKLADMELKFELFQTGMDKKIDHVVEIMPKTGLLEDSVRDLSAKADTAYENIVKLTQKAEGLEKTKADSSYMLSVMSRMTAVEQKLAKSNIEKERIASLLLMVNQMKDAVQKGDKFEVAFESAYSLSKFNRDLRKQMTPLKNISKEGVLTKCKLHKEFKDLARQTMLNERVGVQDTWYKKVLAKVSDLIVIRRLDAEDSDVSVNAVLAKAEQKIRQDLFADAVVELKKMPEDKLALFNDWMISAEKYVMATTTIDNTLDKLLGILYAVEGE